MSIEFRTVVRALRPYINGSYDLTDAADAVIEAVDRVDEPLADWERDLLEGPMSHEERVGEVIKNPNILGFMLAGKKINAIKELRAATDATLLEAKNAVEDERVADFVSRLSDPYVGAEATHHYNYN